MVCVFLLGPSVCLSVSLCFFLYMRLFSVSVCLSHSRFVGLSVSLNISVSVCLSLLFLPLCVSLSPFLCLCPSLSLSLASLSVSLFLLLPLCLFLPACLPTCLSLSLCLRLCLSVCLSLVSLCHSPENWKRTESGCVQDLWAIPEGKIQGLQIIDRLKKRGIETRKSSTIFLERTRKSHRQTNDELFQDKLCWNFWEIGLVAHL